ncbi:MAG: GtrA family protein [Clostridia bacterium]|nr:GtrA family protein [Clostridia bacterium]
MKYRRLPEKYRDTIPYVFFGILTTLVNILVYWLMAHVLCVPVMASTIIAWFAAVFFAYVTNRKWAFHSEAKGRMKIAKEIVSFYACRLATGLLDWTCMYVFADMMQQNDLAVKMLSTVMVVVLNYLASKTIIFRRDWEKKNETV